MLSADATIHVPHHLTDLFGERPSDLGTIRLLWGAEIEVKMACGAQGR